MVEKMNQIESVLEKYPSLEYDKEKDIIFGMIEVDENDKYEIQVLELNRFPNKFPMVREIGERIPRKADRHIYENTFSCCFTTPSREQILLKTRIKSLLNFMDLIVAPYFQNNSYYEINKEYSQGEYSHAFGIIESYVDILEIDNLETTLFLLLREVQPKFRLKPIDMCYCGNGKKLKNCHRKSYRNLQKV